MTLKAQKTCSLPPYPNEFMLALWRLRGQLSTSVTTLKFRDSSFTKHRVLSMLPRSRFCWGRVRSHFGFNFVTPNVGGMQSCSKAKATFSREVRPLAASL